MIISNHRYRCQGKGKSDEPTTCPDLSVHQGHQGMCLLGLRDQGCLCPGFGATRGHRSSLRFLPDVLAVGVTQGGIMLDRHQAMFEVVDVLNDQVIEDLPDEITSEYGLPFDFNCNGDEAGIAFLGQTIVDTVNGPGENKQEWLLGLKKELDIILQTVQSSIFAVDKTLEMENGQDQHQA